MAAARRIPPARRRTASTDPARRRETCERLYLMNGATNVTRRDDRDATNDTESDASTTDAFRFIHACVHPYRLTPPRAHTHKTDP